MGLFVQDCLLITHLAPNRLENPSLAISSSWSGRIYAIRVSRSIPELAPHGLYRDPFRSGFKTEHKLQLNVLIKVRARIRIGT